MIDTKGLIPKTEKDEKTGLFTAWYEEIDNASTQGNTAEEAVNLLNILISDINKQR